MGPIIQHEFNSPSRKRNRASPYRGEEGDSNKENVPPSRGPKRARLGDLVQEELDRHFRFEHRMVQEIRELRGNMERILQYLIALDEKGGGGE